MAAEFDPYYEWFGIPPKDQPPNHYRLLGIELFEENRNVIDTAANRQMSFIKEYQAGEHSALTQKLLNELSAARLCLLDREKKAAYDGQLRAGLKAKETPSRRPPIRRGSKTDGATETTAAAKEPEEVVPLQGGEKAGLAARRNREGSESSDRREVPVPISSQPLRVPMTAPIAAQPVLPPLSATEGPASDLEDIVPLSTPVYLPSAKHATVRSDESGLRSKRRAILYGLAAGLACVACVAFLAFFVASLLRRTGPPDRPMVERDVTSSPLAAKVVAPLPDRNGSLEGAASQRAGDHDEVDAADPPREGNPKPAPPLHPDASGASPPSTGSDVKPPMPAEAREPPAIAETLQQAEERLNADAARASSAAAQQTLAQQALSLADQAVLDSQSDAAKRLAALAFAAARKSESPDLIGQATLLMVDLKQPISEPMKDRARQRLSQSRAALSSQSASTRADDPAARHKASVPESQAQEASQKAAAELYAGSFQQAKTAADKTRLAKEMVAAARKMSGGSADEYVLLRIARDVAAGAGDAETALQAIEEIGERFDVPAAKLQAETLLTVARQANGATPRKTLAEAAVRISGDLANDGEYELALTLCEAVGTLAQEAKDYAQVKELSDKRAEVERRKVESQGYREALAVLANDPTDPAANLPAGRYLCFVKGDWERGLPMLALGSDVELNALAIQDLRGTNSADEQVALGDAWWARAETSSETEQDNLRLRAGFWYRQAEPNLAGGLAGMKVKQRLAELSKLGLDASSPSQGSGTVGGRSSGEQTAAAASLIAQAQQLIDRSDYGEARKKLMQVSLNDPDNPQACFYLGLLAGLVEHNSTDARKYFVRARKSEANGAACLNNLALVTIRTGDVKQAISYWKEALDLGPSPDVAHNVGVLFQLADRKRAMVPAAMREAIEKDLNSPQVTEASSGAAMRPRRGGSYSSGWRYMDFVDASAGTDGWQWPNLIDRTCMQCNGVGTAGCQVRGCSRGRVRVSTMDTIPLPGGHVVRKERIVPVPCKTCRGTGRVSCPSCKDGIDRDL